MDVEDGSVYYYRCNYRLRVHKLVKIFVSFWGVDLMRLTRECFSIKEISPRASNAVIMTLEEYWLVERC
jgi:hypothetical protein